MSDPIAVVDLFSGPGGLGEGFSACRGLDGRRRYRISLSIEKEESAHRTLRMRAFLHQFEIFPPEYYAWLNGKVEEPDWKKLFPKEWAMAEDEARCMELGTNGCTRFLQDRLVRIREQHGGRTLLIGGPPCQAYSLVGRARNSGISGYQPELDQRNFLYDEYVRVLERLGPAAFVMENVKGMLSASVQGNAIFEQVMKTSGMPAGLTITSSLLSAPSAHGPLRRRVRRIL
jgi:DNA (cytosine-5)-methyltransferase 1